LFTPNSRPDKSFFLFLLEEKPAKRENLQKGS